MNKETYAFEYYPARVWVYENHLKCKYVKPEDYKNRVGEYTYVPEHKVPGRNVDRTILQPRLEEKLDPIWVEEYRERVMSGARLLAPALIQLDDKDYRSPDATFAGSDGNHSMEGVFAAGYTHIKGFFLSNSEDNENHAPDWNARLGGKQVTPSENLERLAMIYTELAAQGNKPVIKDFCISHGLKTSKSHNMFGHVLRRLFVSKDLLRRGIDPSKIVCDDETAHNAMLDQLHVLYGVDKIIYEKIAQAATLHMIKPSAIDALIVKPYKDTNMDIQQRGVVVQDNLETLLLEAAASSKGGRRRGAVNKPLESQILQATSTLAGYFRRATAQQKDEVSARMDNEKARKEDLKLLISELKKL